MFYFGPWTSRAMKLGFVMAAGSIAWEHAAISTATDDVLADVLPGIYEECCGSCPPSTLIVSAKMI